MKWKTLTMVGALALAACNQNPSQQAQQAEARPLDLFGVPLQGADRATLREAFKQSGLIAKDEPDGAEADTYDSSQVLEGTYQLKVGYVPSTGKFAYAEYTFFTDRHSSREGSKSLEDVVNMVQIKYGSAQKQQQQGSFGEQRFGWHFAGHQLLYVTGGSPFGSTRLGYVDHAAVDQRNAELRAMKNAQDQQKAQAQSSAF